MLLLHLTEQMDEFTTTQASQAPPGGGVLHIHLTVSDGARAQLRIPECFCCLDPKMVDSLCVFSHSYGDTNPVFLGSFARPCGV